MIKGKKKQMGGEKTHFFLFFSLAPLKTAAENMSNWAHRPHKQKCFFEGVRGLEDPA